MDSVESLVAQVQGLSGSGDDISHLHNQLKQADDMLHAQAGRLQPALQELDPAKHSLGYLYFLEARSSLTLSPEEVESFLVTTSTFIRIGVPEQIRLAPEKFNTLCRRMKDHAIQMQKPKRMVVPLQLAIQKLQISSEYLTPLHADFLQVCLLSKCYKAALDILKDDIFEIDQKRTGLVPRDFLLYCYYGGMVLIGLKQFDRTLEFLQNAITAPATVLSAITIEAYKKYVFVCLIHIGQLPAFPKYTPSVVQRSLKCCTQSYIEFANVYATRNITDLKRSLAVHENTFKNDRNLGLAKQVESSLYKRNIQRLTQTFLTLSLHDIAETVHLDGPKEAELYILQMIQGREIFATINQKDGMVSFQEDPEQYKTREMTQRLHTEIHKVIEVAKKLASVDEQVSCDRAYISKLGKDHHARFDSDDFELVPQKVYANV